METGLYHPDLGYWQTTNTPTSEDMALYPAGTIEVPVKPTRFHTFNGTGWDAPTQELLDEFEGKKVRFKRDELLLGVDAMVTNPLRWAALDTDTQAAWAAYRQALLDVSAQDTFPYNVAWPAKPTEG